MWTLCIMTGCIVWGASGEGFWRLGVRTVTNPRNVMSWNGLDVAAVETAALFGPQLPVMNTSNTQPADAEETRTTLAEDIHTFILFIFFFFFSFLLR